MTSLLCLKHSSTVTSMSVSCQAMKEVSLLRSSLNVFLSSFSGLKIYEFLNHKLRS